MKNPYSIQITVNLLVTLLISSKLFSQPGNYNFIGSDVIKYNTLTSEIMDTVQLLVGPTFTDDEIDVTTVRYGPNGTSVNSAGQPFTLERLMDIYTPKPHLKLVHNGVTISKLPLMVVLHAGAGDRISAQIHAYNWARKGYTVVVPNMRSGRFGSRYCVEAPAVVYKGVQDARAAVRAISLLNDQSRATSIEEIEATWGTRASLGKRIKRGRIDGYSIFFYGLSYGGSVAYHIAARVNQDQYEPFLADINPYYVMVDGVQVNIGSLGHLDFISRVETANYPFPINRVRGSISRTAGISPLDQISYSAHPNPVPACFIQGTCDRSIPYNSKTIYGNDLICDARVTFLDGTSDSTFTYYGSNQIHEQMKLSGIYSQLVTFCGGGHDSNGCVEEIVDEKSVEFSTKILKGEVSIYDQSVDYVYRYHPLNYSAQCCTLGDEYGYLDKCSCETSNTLEVIDLPYISTNSCNFNSACELTDYCAMTNQEAGDSPISATISDQGSSSLFLEKHEEILHIVSNDLGEMTTYIEIWNMKGQKIYKTNLLGNNERFEFKIPLDIPKNQLLLATIPGHKPLKFFVHEY